MGSTETNRPLTVILIRTDAVADSNTVGPLFGYVWLLYISFPAVTVQYSPHMFTQYRTISNNCTQMINETQVYRTLPNDDCCGKPQNNGYTDAQWHKASQHLSRDNDQRPPKALW